MRRVAALLVLCTACSTAVPSVTPSTPSLSSSSSAEASGVEVAEPGRPFDATAILEAMRTSRRPGGVPDELETERIAGAVAEAIWTFDGRPWTTMSIGGSCGTDTCLLEVAGTRPGMAGEDLWVFEAAPAPGDVALTTAELHSVPKDLVARLDETLSTDILSRMARGTMALTSVRWLPPPDEGHFVLGYRSGGEEGSCGVDVTVHAPTAEVVSETTLDC